MLKGLLFVLSYLGQLVSNKKEELVAILDHFNIQVTIICFLKFEVLLRKISGSGSERECVLFCVCFSWIIQYPFSAKK